MCENVSGGFAFFTTLWFIAFFALAIVNMIFSIITPKNVETFKMVNFTNYNNVSIINFMREFQFEKDKQGINEFSSSLTIQKVCYIGRCELNSTFYISNNCSEACFNLEEDCYYEDQQQKCDNYKCSKTSYSDSGICHELNRIKKWRNAEITKFITEYKIIPFSQIKPKNENCNSNYQKCGIINRDGDILCLEKGIECPINEIIVSSENIKPGKYNYKEYKIGDKYIFYTNENTNNYLIQLFYIDFDINIEKDYINVKTIDNDSFENLKKYNQIDRNYKYKKAYLSYVHYYSNYTYQEMLKFQDIYNKTKEITKDIIDKMNSNVNNFKYLIMGFGIAILAYLAIVSFYFLPSYECGFGCISECALCQNITPIKRVIHFYLTFLPSIVLSILSFFIVILKKITYNKYSSMAYINEFYAYKDDYNRDPYFPKSIFCNNAQFISLLIFMFFLILYPILIKLTSPRNKIIDESTLDFNNDIYKNDLNNDFLKESPNPLVDNYNSQIINYNTSQGNYISTNQGVNSYSNYQGEKPYYG